MGKNETITKYSDHLYSIHSFAANYVQAPITFSTQTCYLILRNQRFKLLSLTTNLRIWNNNSALMEYIPGSTTQRFNLTIGNPGLTENITKTFYNYTLPGSVNAQGNIVRFWEPGQYFFNSFYCYNQLQLSYVVENADAVDPYHWEVMLIAEVLRIQID